MPSRKLTKYATLKANLPVELNGTNIGSLDKYSLCEISREDNYNVYIKLLVDNVLREFQIEKTLVVIRYLTQDDITVKYGDSNCKDKVWNKGKKIKGFNCKEWRLDTYDNIIRYSSFGKHTNEDIYGWQQDHIIPSSKGGSDYLHNLQPLISNINESKGNSLVKKSIQHCK